MQIPKSFRFLRLVQSAIRFNSTTKDLADETPIGAPAVDPNVQHLQRESELNKIPEYVAAIKYSSEAKYDLSDEYFYRTLKRFDTEKQYPYHIAILKK